jgi:acetylornithine/succinyldiaminopimelate/putrescine aminotransferase
MKNYNDLFVPTYARTGSPFVRGKGMYLFDAAGKKHLDFGAGIAVSALGHSHPAIVKALVKNGSQLLHTSNLYFTQSNVSFAELLSKHVLRAGYFSATAAPRRTRLPLNSHGNGPPRRQRASIMSCRSAMVFTAGPMAP